MGRSRRKNKIRNKTRNKKNIMKGGATRLDRIEDRLNAIERTLKLNKVTMGFLGEQSALHGQMQGQGGASL